MLYTINPYSENQYQLRIFPGKKAATPWKLSIILNKFYTDKKPTAENNLVEAESESMQKFSLMLKGWERNSSRTLVIG